jgi:hypothetical protein
MADDDVTGFTSGASADDALGRDDLSDERLLGLERLQRNVALIVVWLSFEKVLESRCGDNWGLVGRGFVRFAAILYFI